MKLGILVYKTGKSFTKRESRLRRGNLAYKTGISFTKWEPCVTNGTLVLLFTSKLIFGLNMYDTSLLLYSHSSMMNM